MITYLSKLFKIFPYVELVLYQSFFCTKTLDIPQYLSNQLVLKVLNAKIATKFRNTFLPSSLQAICSKESSSLIIELCNINL